MKILTCREMRLVEAAAAADGLDYLRLMENAGSAAARLSQHAMQPTDMLEELCALFSELEQ